MCMEDKAVKEINELKAQVKLQGNALKLISKWDSCNVEFRINYGSNGERDYYREIASRCIVESPPQCLKQHDLDLLNQLKDKFINSNQSCELILADMINSLELEK